jgi:ATP-binding cassette, subfamily B (MDR/TAP), member 1
MEEKHQLPVLSSMDNGTDPIMPTSTKQRDDDENNTNSDERNASAPASVSPHCESEPDKSTQNSKTTFRPFFRLLCDACFRDHLLRCLAFLSAIAFGAAIPLMTVVFGNTVDDLNGWGSGTDGVAALVQNGSRNALWLTWLFLGCFASVFLSVLCFRTTALRTSTSLRQRFIRALISQDIQYLDSCPAGKAGTLVSTNAELVEGGIGERVTVFVSGCSMLFSAFIVAFIQSWRLTLVVALLIPLSAVVAGFAVVADSKLNARIYAVYAEAAGLAEEALSTMKIVAAFGAGPKLQKKYQQYLEVAKGLCIRQSPLRALQFSVVMATTYLSYAMAWFYGTHLLSTGIMSSGGRVIVYECSFRPASVLTEGQKWLTTGCTGF